MIFTRGPAVKYTVKSFPYIVRFSGKIVALDQKSQDKF